MPRRLRIEFGAQSTTSWRGNADHALVVQMLNGVTDVEEQLQPDLGRHVRALPKNVVFNDFSAP